MTIRQTEGGDLINHRQSQVMKVEMAQGIVLMKMNSQTDEEQDKRYTFCLPQPVHDRLCLAKNTVS